MTYTYFKRMKFSFFLSAALAMAACNTNEQVPAAAPNTATTQQPVEKTAAIPVADRKEVPILCYHRIQPSPVKPTDYTMSIELFNEHIKILADSGYHSILPEQLLAYLESGKPLPSKPVIISFDDTRAEHFSIAAPVLEKHGYKAVFFIMTVAIGKPGYMTADQIKQLADKGHEIGSHTYDHQNVKKMVADDWKKQLDESSEKLKHITGKEIRYFAYPFGVWNDAAVTELKKRPIKAAFQLTAKQSPSDPLYTIRRLLVTGYWSDQKLLAYIHGSFHVK